MGHSSDSQVAEVKAVIAKLPRDSQLRIEAVAAALRAMLTFNAKQDVEIAITLVLAELCAAAPADRAPAAL
jgi:hypothetical protein